jgi:NAD(P)-dependent dehydrogenase (short-subunit alcohol dehydrogenase family)
VYSERFSGQVVVITGGARGLGRGLAEALARAGAKVVVGDIGLGAAEAFCAGLSGEGLTANAVHLDVTDPASVDRLVTEAVARHGCIDIMINNAGIAAGGEFEHVPVETMRRVIDINLLGAAYGTLSAYRQMLRQGGGHIVNVASMLALFPNPLSAAYVAAKHGLAGLTRSVMAEGAAHGIHFTTVCPGYIATSLFEAGAFAGSMKKDHIVERIPFRFIDVETAVQRTLAAVAGRKPIAVFPFYARALWWIERLSPRLMDAALRAMLRQQQRRFGSSTGQ